MTGRQFFALVRHRGVRGAVLHAANAESIQELAQLWGVERSRLSGMLHGSSGRAYEPERRTAEVWLRLPPYILDKVLDA